MPSYLKLVLAIGALTLVVPVFVLGASQSWRAAWRAWRMYCIILLALAAPGIVTGLWMLAVGP